KRMHCACGAVVFTTSCARHLEGLRRRGVSWGARQSPRVDLQLAQDPPNNGLLGGGMSSGHQGREPCPAYASPTIASPTIASPTISRREILVAGGLSLMTGAARQAAAASPDQL